jgi:hypothetical protein
VRFATSQAVQRAFEASQGRPWLVNALAREVIEEMKVTGPIDDEHMDQAVERLILARATHLDSLVARLREPRIQRILEPIMYEAGRGRSLRRRPGVHPRHGPGHPDPPGPDRQTDLPRSDRAGIARRCRRDIRSSFMKR